MKVLVTKHAQERYIERFRLTMHKSMQTLSGATHIIKIKLKESSRSDFALRQQIGKYNSLCIRYGGRCEFYQTKCGKTLAGIRRGDTLIIQTVYKTRECSVY